MIARIKRHRVGLSDYLLKGIKQESEYTRDEKDNVVSLYGNFETFKKTEQFLYENKNYKDNYLHITISFNKEDMDRLNRLDHAKKSIVYKQMVLDYIKHHTSGYDLENEVIAYAEVHQPKIKDENNKERLEHIHIGIALYNPNDNTKLRTAFKESDYLDNALQTYCNLKYGLTMPHNYARIREEQTQTRQTRAEWIEKLKYIKSQTELKEYFKTNNINYQEVRTKNNHYFKIKDAIKDKKSNIKDLNLRGKGFEHISQITQNSHIVLNQEKELQDFQNTLNDYYKKREELISVRRSKEATQNLEEAKKEQVQDESQEEQEEIEYKEPYQNILFYKHYKKNIDMDLKSFYVNTDESNITKIISRERNIAIVDKGITIVSYIQNENSIEERVRLMLEMAQAKEWNLSKLYINGSKEFKKEMNKQIAQILEQQRTNKTLSHTEAERSITQQNLNDAINKEESQKAQNDISIKNLKLTLKAQTVLDYAVQKYKIDTSKYEITNNNKINNKDNRQTPKNVIDFFQREFHSTTKESINICKELYTKQEQHLKNMNDLNITLSISKDKNINALNDWEQIRVKSLEELTAYMKQYPYSQAKFENGYRNGDNVNGVNNLLIYDIDNDPDKLKLSLNDAKELLKKQNIQALILPSKSHQKEKFTKNGKSKGIEDRYRIVIPTNNAISLGDKETYREFQKLASKELGLEKYIDKQALNDQARFYYKSPVSAEAIVIRGNKLFNTEKMELQSIENVKVKEQETERTAVIKREVRTFVKGTQTNDHILTLADTEKIMQLDIKRLISNFENGAKSYKEGSYEIIKTKDAKYSILENNMVHNFKTDTTYNVITYLKKYYQTENLNKIARNLQNEIGENYMKLNIEGIKKAVEQARQNATNDKTFEQELKNWFDVKYVKLENDTIKIADQEITLEKINTDKKEIVQDLRQNREYQKDIVIK